MTWDDRGRVLVDWGKSFAPPPRHDQAAETALTNALFDELEIAIGRHPVQHLEAAGFDRYWDNQAGRWRDRA
jgi:hypothetical protein